MKVNHYSILWFDTEGVLTASAELETVEGEAGRQLMMATIRRQNRTNSLIGLIIHSAEILVVLYGGKVDLSVGGVGFVAAAVVVEVDVGAKDGKENKSIMGRTDSMAWHGHGMAFT